MNIKWGFSEDNRKTILSLFNLPHNLVHGRLTGLHLGNTPSALAQSRLRDCASELMTLGVLPRY